MAHQIQAAKMQEHQAFDTQHRINELSDASRDHAHKAEDLSQWSEKVRCPPSTDKCRAIARLA